MSYSSNLPPEIQEKVERLAECHKQITGLESQLIQFKKEKDRLEEELLDYRVDKPFERPNTRRGQVAVAARSMSIQKLPDEMLLRVFEYFLSKKHRLIHTLLLVCKHWNHMIMQSPRLWARIQLSPVGFEEYMHPYESPPQYVEVFIQRSQSVLLDIELDYSSHKPRFEYVRDKVLDAVSGVSTSETLHNQILDLQFESPEYDSYFQYTMDELSTLVGPMGANMKKWRSLHVQLPMHYPRLALEILQMLCGVASNLQSMSLSPIGYILDPNDRGWFNEDGTPLLSIPNLRSLEFNDWKAANLLKDIVMTPSTLVHLDIWYDHDLRGLSQLQEFTTLRTLTLRTRGYCEQPPVPENENLTIFLPELRELNLLEDLSPLKAVQFDLPSLQCLRVGRCNPKFGLPANVYPEYIHWSTHHFRRYYNTIESMLGVVLQPSSRVAIISICKISQEDYETILEVLHKAPDLPVSLKTVVVDVYKGGRVHIDVVALRS
ncbi:hypothetical protein M408DRAFT_327487 [Serendipita vermifera MAFF 305830]|uniref:F-box domain-containing protein n=1 Tax=Serendipita vermifera MAFF 305830 TaxID=933852 RepID=A0A0C2XQJ1_SERVB|nr:hypothetical protein M408DRAFT_327487 [Serendipita vermifera MAFF 305830]